MPSNIPRVSWREQKSLQKTSSRGGMCLHCPSFQGATLFIVTHSDHIVLTGARREPASNLASQFTSAPYSPFVEGGRKWCSWIALVFLSDFLISPWLHNLSFVNDAGLGTAHLITLCLWVGHPLCSVGWPISVFQSMKWA